ncbi:hypothetical protein [Streptomyces mesophilus]|uniref:hypothetical protein n=1 Tax=Streptomyces mesophilus TaxID=1775132 RepID=UPI0033345B64
MNREDQAGARAVARYLVQWLCGLIAVGALLLLAAVVLITDPSMLVYSFKQGMLWPLIGIAVLSLAVWLTLLVAGAATRDHDR